MRDIDEFCDPEQAEWYRMTPQQRFDESRKLWEVYLALGGSLDPEYDSQSPFYDEEEWRTLFAHRGQACILYGAAEFSRDIDSL